MNDHFLKNFVKGIFFRDGSVKKIAFGPLKEKKYKVSKISGISAWYSGQDRSMQKAFKSHLKSGDVVVDMGCNWGVHSLLLSDLVGNDGKVLAIEASPDVAEEAKWHFRENSSSNVTLLECAVSDKIGTMYFCTNGLSTTGHLVEKPTNDNDIKVPVTNLDQIVKDLKITKLNLIKIDIEGNEHNALIGSKETLRKFRPILVIELHTPEQDLLVSKFVRDFGYTIKRIDGSNIESPDETWPNPKGVWGCIICYPSNETNN